MKQVHAMMVGCLAGIAACVAGGPGYLPQAGPAALRFGPAREAAWVQARSTVASWPALPTVTLKRVDTSDTNLASAAITWPPPASQDTNSVPGSVGSTSTPQAPIPQYIDPGMWPTEGGGWWQILTNAPAAVLTPRGSAVLAVPIPPQAFIPPVAAPKSRATYSTGP